jgi:hypothetical protein
MRAIAESVGASHGPSLVPFTLAVRYSLVYFPRLLPTIEFFLFRGVDEEGAVGIALLQFVMYADGLQDYFACAPHKAELIQKVSVE